MIDVVKDESLDKNFRILIKEGMKDLKRDIDILISQIEIGEYDSKN
jgi:hypothetical protein